MNLKALTGRNGLSRKVSDTSRRQKMQSALSGNPKNNWVKTIGIMSPMNPMGDILSKDENDKRKEKFDKMLKRGHYVYFKAKGVYGEPETYYMIYNVEFDSIKNWSMYFKQDSFIYVRLDRDSSNKLIYTFEFWKHVSKEIDGVKKITTYKLLDKQTIKGKVENLSETDDLEMFTQLNRNFKFYIPFDLDKQIDEVNEIVEDSIKRHPSVNMKEIFDNTINPKKTGYFHWQNRHLLYGKLG